MATAPTPAPAPETETETETETEPAPWAMSKYRQIGFLMEAGLNVDPDDYLSHPRWINRLLREGVVYKDKKKRYWVDAKDRDCFAIYARGLNITNSDRRVYWQWKTEREGSEGSESIEVAEVVKTRWLEVRGSFWTMNLSPNVQYKVSFWIKMVMPTSQGTEDVRVSTMKGQTVNLRLTPPDGSNQERPASLPTGDTSTTNNPCHELEVGRFTMTAQNVGKMEFAMEQLFRRWRTGLAIKCVEIKAV